MPPLERHPRDQRQRITLWDFAGSYADDGSPQCLAPVEIWGQWKTSRRRVMLPDGSTVELSAEAAVSQKIGIHSIMWPGEYEDFLGTGSGSGMTDPELHEVVTYKELKDLKGQIARREIGLIKYRQEPPTVV